MAQASQCTDFKRKLVKAAALLSLGDEEVGVGYELLIPLASEAAQLPVMLRPQAIKCLDEAIETARPAQHGISDRYHWLGKQIMRHMRCILTGEGRRDDMWLEQVANTPLRTPSTELLI